MRGARIGVPSDPGDPGNDVYYGPLQPRAAAVMRDAIAVLEAAGAVLVRANISTIGWMGGPGTAAAILNRNPESRTFNQPDPVVYLYELKHDLDAYLRDWAKGTKMRTMADIVAFNDANAGRALRFGQDIFRAAAGGNTNIRTRALRSPFPPSPRSKPRLTKPPVAAWSKRASIPLCRRAASSRSRSPICRIPRCQKATSWPMRY
jgi:amidase